MSGLLNFFPFLQKNHQNDNSNCNSSRNDDPHGSGNEKNKDVLNGHEIGAAFPILIGPSMKDAVFAHQLWCGVRNMGRGERTGRTTAAVVHEDKVDALEWLRDVYVPLHENGL